MAKPPRIWLTRPHADSAALADLLAQRGIANIIAPVMRIERNELAADLTNKPNALLLTSRHAVHALEILPPDWRSLPLFAVGAATAEAARQSGFTNIHEGSGGMLELLPHITQALSANARLLYCAGEETSSDVGALLTGHAIHVDQITAYRAIAETSLPEGLCSALTSGDIKGVVLFSARSAQLVEKLLKHHQLEPIATHIDAYCLSLPVAAAAGGLPWKSLRACHLPTQAAMVELLVSHLDSE